MRASYSSPRGVNRNRKLNISTNATTATTPADRNASPSIHFSTMRATAVAKRAESPAR